MSKPYGIILLGANGSGKSTLGRELARVLNFAHFDVEEYYFYQADIPYTAIRSADERNEMLLSDIRKHGSFVMSGDISGWSDEFLKLFDLVIFLTVPTNIRLKRIENREFERWGDRVRKGGDMYDQQQKFREFAASRDISQLEQRTSLYSCSILRVDGTKPLKENTDGILTYINTRNHYDAIIDEINDPLIDNVTDPAHDSEPLKSYMDKWDGEAFIKALKLTPAKSVLEIGVGTGRLALRVCGKCGNFTGIDISQKTVERAKKNLRDFTNVNLICGDYLTHHFDKTFDVIYSSLTFMHIRDKQEAIQRALDLLNPNGRFVLSIDKNQQTEIDYGTRRIPVFPDTPKETHELLTKAGFTIKQQFETEFAVIFIAVKWVAI